MITDDDRRALADLAMRALDKATEEYGDDAELVAASLVFEIKAPDENGEMLWNGHYESLPNMSPHHIAGLLHTTANYITETNE